MEQKKRVLESARKLSYARDEIIDLFEKGIFLYNDKLFKTKENKESQEKSEKNEFFKDIENESKGINYELFKKHCNSPSPTVWAKELFETKDERRNNDLVKLIMVKWSILKDEIEKMSENENKN